MVKSMKLVMVVLLAATLNLPSGPTQMAAAQAAEGTWETVSDHFGAYKAGHTAVWTGNEMIVWGGRSREGLAAATGGAYDPQAGTWRRTSTEGAPAARSQHTAVWTGSEMIVWGGQGYSYQQVEGTGGRYDPATDTWRPVATTGAPAGRYGHTAIWTGQEMIVWGGRGADSSVLGDGARYDPASDTWRPLSASGAPGPRYGHRAVWTGSEMIVWGGGGPDGHALADGARYDPATDSWRPLAAAPLSGRGGYAAVWTGREMIVWGGNCGEDCLPAEGARYDPAKDAWTQVSATGAPPPRSGPSAVWTGTEVIFWGGAANRYDGRQTSYPVGQGDGGRYDPVADAWRPVAAGAGARYGHTAVWTGEQMLVWGGTSGISPTSEAGGAAYTPPSAAAPRDERYFPLTGFRVDDDTIWDYFVHRGGVQTFGYPISRKFTFLGFQTQFFQRRVVQLDEQGRARLLNILDPGLLPYTRFNGATVPAHDEALVATAPDPTDSRAVLAWVQAQAPQTFDDKPVGFYRTFLDTVSLDVAGPDPSFLPGFALEMWGAPTSRPMLDPNNHEFVYLRFQRGIMMYDGATRLTQGVLLGDMLKAVITGQHLPPDLEEQARGSRLYRQYAPGQSLWLQDAGALPHTDLTGAFERQ